MLYVASELRMVDDSEKLSSITRDSPWLLPAHLKQLKPRLDQHIISPTQLFSTGCIYSGYLVLQELGGKQCKENHLHLTLPQQVTSYLVSLCCCIIVPSRKQVKKINYLTSLLMG